LKIKSFTLWEGKKMKLLHFGELDPVHVLVPPRVIGDNIYKPGGYNILWTSPLNSSCGWKDWAARPMPHKLQTRRWILELEPDARIIRLNGPQDERRLARRFPSADKDKLLDWPALAKTCDAFWLTRKELRDSRWFFRSWDCETVVVFNVNAIASVTEITPPGQRVRPQRRKPAVLTRTRPTTNPTPAPVPVIQPPQPPRPQPSSDSLFFIMVMTLLMILFGHESRPAT